MGLQKFSHSGNIGDVLAAIPAMNTFYEKTCKKVHLDLIANVPAFYYDGAIHPTKSTEAGIPVMLNEKMIEMMGPLLIAQECIETVGVIQYNEYQSREDILKDHIRLEVIRETNVGMPSMSINRWYFYVYADLACDLTKQWMMVPDSDKDLAKGKIIITRTERYTNPNVDYSFLKPYEDELIFSGTQREYNNFCMSFDLNIKKLTVDNFLTLAQAIKQSRFHISNQTMAFQISEGLRHKRLLEACTFAPNVIVFGEDAYDYLHTPALEHYFKQLYKKTAL